MSAANQTKIFGMKLGIDPKILVVGLMALAGLLFWINSRGDNIPSAGQAAAHVAEPASVSTAPARARTTSDRRRSGRDDRATLKLRTVAPGSGDVDPLLRLDLLEKLAKVEPPAQARNLFEMGPAAPPPQAAALPVRTIVPKPLPPQPVVVPQGPVTPQVNIPLKYYGFAKPSVQGEANRGFFMDGDDIMVAAEGQTLQGRYRVDRLTPTGAKLEDTQVKLSQLLPVTPEALDQGASAYSRQQQMAPGMMQPQMDPNSPNIPAPENSGDPNEP